MNAVVNLMNEFKEGDIVTGKVTGFENYGIFVTFENEYSGLIHISELSENFVKDVHDYAEMGETIPCRVLECNNETKKLKCSIKNTEFGQQKDSLIDHGFMPLKKQLPIWMEEKLREMNQND